MISSVRLHRSILAAALALATLPALADNSSPNTGFTQTVFFGDSLTDSGFYQPVLVAFNGPAAASVARFTTNPGLVYAEFLADYYGTNATPAWQLTPGAAGFSITGAGGDNYAAGGATISPGAGFPPTTFTAFAPSLTTQINAYLAANGGHANPNALFTVWGGANDLFYHLAGATSQAQFLGAAGAEVALVGTLESAGARYVLVPTLPDVGLTPFGLSQGAAASAGITQLSAGYNATLFGGLQAAGLRVIPIDVFHFLREITADPGTYGFTNVTTPACGAAPALGCNPANFVDPNAAETYAYADDVHPSTAAHRLLSQYIISVLEAPGQIAVLPHSEAMVGRARNDMIGTQLTQPATGEGAHWWTSVRLDDQRFGPGGSADRYDGGGPTISVGVDWTRGNFTYGGFGGYGRQSIDFGLRRGNFDQSDTTLGGYFGWKSGNAWVNGQLSYTQLNFDIDRKVRLGPATRVYSSSTKGRNPSAGVNAGWTFGKDAAFQHGPVIGVLAQRIKVDGFAEDRPGESTSLAFPEQQFNSLIGTAGWRASYTSGGWFSPYAELTWDREFKRDAREAFASAQSIPGSLQYAVPVAQYDRSYATLTYGSRSSVWGFDVLSGSALTIGQKGGNHSSFYLTVKKPF